jgi:hypothetical protein
VFHLPRASAALLVAMLLTAAAPAAISAAHATRPDTNPAGQTALDTNLLHNGGFETVPTDATIPGWTASGDVQVEKFGTRPWPDQAYGTTWGGGKRYLTCGPTPGSVTQTVPFVWGSLTGKVKAHLQVDFGGRIGHSIRITIVAKGAGPDTSIVTLKPLDVTNHYKRAVATLGIPTYADHLKVTVGLVGKVETGKCRIAADTVKLIAFQP